MFKELFTRIFTRTTGVEIPDNKNRFNVIYQKMLSIRWKITLITLLSMLAIMVGISTSIVMGTRIVQEWKEIMLFMLGAFIGSYNRVFDYWFNNSQRDDKLIEKMDQENDSDAMLQNKLKAVKGNGEDAVPAAAAPVAEAVAPVAEETPAPAPAPPAA